MYLVDIAESDRRLLGLDLTPTLDVSLAFAAGSAAGIGKPSASLKGGLDSVLKAARTLEKSAIVAQPLFVLGDGQDAKIVRGEKVPVPRRTVSNQGTVTTVGFDFVQTGYSTALHLREVGPESASLKVTTELSTITRFVESAPVTSIESLETVAVLESGGVYLLGSLERCDQVNKQTTWLLWGADNGHKARTLELWCRAYRVAAPATDSLTDNRTVRLPE